MTGEGDRRPSAGGGKSELLNAEMSLFSYYGRVLGVHQTQNGVRYIRLCRVCIFSSTLTILSRTLVIALDFLPSLWSYRYYPLA